MVGCVIAFATGIWTTHDCCSSVSFVSGLSAIFLLFVVYFKGQFRNGFHAHWRTVVLFLLWFVAGMTRMGVAGQDAAGSVREYEGKKVTLHGMIHGEPQISEGGHGEWNARYKVAVDRINEDEKRTLPQEVSGGILLRVRMRQPIPEGADGDSVTVTGIIRPCHGYNNPGQADWASNLASRGIDARISAASDLARFSRHEGPETYVNRLGRWRQQVRSSLLATMTEPEAALVMGMLFGGYDGIERQTVRDFASTGIVHILSVSGAHIALVAGSIFWLTRRLSIPEDWSSGLSAVAMLGYGVVSGFSAPVTRSVIMGLIAMAALGTGNYSFAPRGLSIAVLGMLMYEPRNLFDIGFQLSIGCTAGLLYLYPRILESLKIFLYDWFAEGIAATVAAQLAVLPFLSWYFGTVSIISVAANLLVVPILEAVIVLGLFGVLIAGCFSHVADIVFAGIALLTGTAVSINKSLAGMPGGTANFPAIGIGWGCLYYGIILWLFGICKLWVYSPGDLWRILNRRRYQAPAFGMMLLLVILWVCMRPGPLEVHFIDVGQGDATLVITPNGRAILIDAGGSTVPQNGSEVGERVVVPYLRHYGVNSVEWLILTHNHQDHAGGASAVAEFIGVQHVLMRGEGNSAPEAILRLKQAMNNGGILDADCIGEIHVDGVKVKLLQTGEENFTEKAKGKAGISSSENGRSTVVLIEYGRHRFLVTGDLEGESELKLSEQDIHPTTVLKVGHHGSRKSSQSAFLTRISPRYAVVSVGADNRFGHPHPETMRRLREWPVSVFRTDQDGAVVFRSDGENLNVERYVH